ncbi:hypothetical protein CMI47_20250 [Candidatus Pacearchaeota archaeon]|nr:hypothetical protein [Candidatus Pacearchaeota archaeon]|tara:strand:- start:6364 stop:7392 length:1029 start_codon:yes stop_codon:yes gene_type:complete
MGKKATTHARGLRLKKRIEASEDAREEFLARYRVETIPGLMRQYKVSRGVVFSIAEALGLNHDRHDKFSRCKDDFLRLCPNKTAKELAVLFDITPTTVSYWARRAGLSPLKKAHTAKYGSSGYVGKLTEEAVAKLGKAKDIDIAKELGVSRERVRQWRKLRGIPKFPSRWERVPAEVAQRVAKEKPLLVDFAKELNLTTRMAQLLADAHGLVLVTPTMAIAMRAHDFKRIWDAASTGKEAAKKLGMTLPKASQKASYYRKKGYNLKYFLDEHRRNTDSKFNPEEAEKLVALWNSCDSIDEFMEKNVDGYYKYTTNQAASARMHSLRKRGYFCKPMHRKSRRK